jgi:two-component system chemotaxis sensor kinase CheA
MKHILDNIPMGIAIINKDMTVTAPYSRYMHRLFGESTPVADRSIDTLLYWEDDREKERSTLREWLTMAFDLSYDWDILCDLGPEMIEHDSPNGPLYFRNNFNRIIHENGETLMMIYISDVTEKIRHKAALKDQETARKFELQIFSCIMNLENGSEIVDYINDIERMLHDCESLFMRLNHISDKVPLYNHIFRLMHSIKGLSKTYGMHEFARLAHLIEDILNKYRSNEISFETGMTDGVLASDRFLEIIANMKALLKNGESILRKIFHHGKENAAAIRSRRRGLKIDSSKIEEIIWAIDDVKKIAGKPSGIVVDHLEALRNKMFQLTLQPLDVVFNRFHNIVRDVSLSLDKQIDLATEGDRVFMDAECHHLIISSLIHLLRNALDHGIETPAQRQANGKNPVGTIRIESKMNNGRICITLSDDGRGINSDSISREAVTRGFVTLKQLEGMTDQQRIELILIPGFSVKDHVTELSGRGVGMDVVIEAMTEMKGSLKITSVPNQGTSFILEFPAMKPSDPSR